MALTEGIKTNVAKKERRFPVSNDCRFSYLDPKNVDIRTLEVAAKRIIHCQYERNKTI